MDAPRLGRCSVIDLSTKDSVEAVSFVVRSITLPYFLEISPRRHLISWSSLARRHFEGGQILRVATRVLVVTMGERAHCALFRINVNMHMQ